MTTNRNPPPITYFTSGRFATPRGAGKSSSISLEHCNRWILLFRSLKPFNPGREISYLNFVNVRKNIFHFEPLKQWHSCVRPYPIHQGTQLEQERRQHVHFERTQIENGESFRYAIAQNPSRITATYLVCRQQEVDTFEHVVDDWRCLSIETPANRCHLNVLNVSLEIKTYRSLSNGTKKNNQMCIPMTVMNWKMILPAKFFRKYSARSTIMDTNWRSNMIKKATGILFSST